MSSDELSLKPFDDDEKVVVAPEIPFSPDVRWIPVVCMSCRSRLYAAESQVGMYKLCPDCDRKTLIRAVAEQHIVSLEIDENGGYIIKAPEAKNRPVLQPLADYRNFDPETGRAAPSAPVEEQQPYLERMLDGVLTSNKETAAKKRHKERYEAALQINREIRSSIKDGVQAAKSLTEKSSGDGWDTHSIKKDSAAKKHAAFAALDDLIEKTEETTDETRAANSVRGTADNDYDDSTMTLLGDGFFAPFWDERNRKRLLFLLIAGFISFIFSGKAKSIVWLGLTDTHPSGPGHITGSGELLQFFILFLAGSFLVVIWAIVVLLVGIGIFEQTAKGEDRFHSRIQFDLSYGASHLFWIFVFYWMSGLSGWAIWQIVTRIFSDAPISILPFVLISNFLTFPIIFLAAFETDTFYKGYPRKTLSSLRQRPLLWLQLYGSQLLLLTPVFLFWLGLLAANYYLAESRLLQTFVYHLFVGAINSIMIAAMPILFFRLLGRMSRNVSDTQL